MYIPQGSHIEHLIQPRETMTANISVHPQQSQMCHLESSRKTESSLNPLHPAISKVLDRKDPKDSSGISCPDPYHLDCCAGPEGWAWDEERIGEVGGTQLVRSFFSSN